MKQQLVYLETQHIVVIDRIVSPTNPEYPALMLELHKDKTTGLPSKKTKADQRKVKSIQKERLALMKLSKEQLVEMYLNCKDVDIPNLKNFTAPIWFKEVNRRKGVSDSVKLSNADRTKYDDFLSMITKLGIKITSKSTGYGLQTILSHRQAEWVPDIQTIDSYLKKYRKEIK